MGVDIKVSIKVSRDGWHDNRQEGYIQRILLVTTLHIGAMSDAEQSSSKTKVHYYGNVST